MTPETLSQKGGERKTEREITWEGSGSAPKVTGLQIASAPHPPLEAYPRIGIPVDMDKVPSTAPGEKDGEMTT